VIAPVLSHPPCTSTIKGYYNMGDTPSKNVDTDEAGKQDGKNLQEILLNFC
jgi:hypothetical protein